MADNPVRLQAREVSYHYPDGTAALGQINLAIHDGEFIGLLGANGSGKTTLLKVLDGLIRDFKGTVTLDGSNIKTLTAKEIYGKMGMVFQNPDDQLFASTVFEDVAFGPINMGFPDREVKERVTRAMTDVEMEGFAKKSIHHLSFGQKKRICIAGLLAMGHQVLLLDEPTAGLDPMGEYKMMNLLTKLNTECRVTIVMATHSVDLVPIFLDRLYILVQGRIVRSGTPEEVLTAPEEMTQVKLRLPQIAELIYRLKHEDRLPFKKIPLTIGEARRELLRMLEDKDKVANQKKVDH
jgi:cobalt/nickel transport system ATP-binding protein